jgi:hypothetical protein
VLADYKFQILDKMPPSYFRNVAAVQRTAQELGLEIYPAVCPIGYSSGLLAHDPNLAEGLPVRDARFVVKGQEADLTADPPVALAGDFEQARDQRFAGWELQDWPGAATFADRERRHGGSQSLRMEKIGATDPRNGHARVMQRVVVSPFRQYHLTVWIKTEGFETPGNARAAVLTPGERDLSYATWSIKPTQDWTQYHAVFNSLDNRQLRLYLGVWEGKGGKIWWDDAKLEEVGLLNLLRRDGCPLTVKGEDGTAFQEGRDLEPVQDPRLHGGRWDGEYDVYHKPPVLRLTSGSRLKEGQTLRVSFYHNVLIHGEQVTCCLSEPKVYALLRDQIERVNQLLHPRGFFMNHDEIRVANWCDACRRRGLTPGQLLADNVRRCVGMIRSVSPNARIIAWSDMFDPYHNARDDYYLVNGTWAGAWEGLPRDAVIANWYFEQRRKNMPWFARRGHPQLLAGYYDSKPERIRDWLADAEAIPNVTGVMYTTWEHRYDDLEAFARAAWGR